MPTEKQLANLRPQKAGEPSHNPAGKPKGIKNWSTIVQKLLEDEQFVEKALDKKPGWWETLPGKNTAYAVTAAMAIKAMRGDTKAAQWLRETGFGSKVTIEGGEKPIPILATLNVPSNNSIEKDKLPEPAHSSLSGRDSGGENDSDTAVPDKPSSDSE